MTIQNTIERELLVQASIDSVWSALTEADQISKWFASGGAGIDLRPAGTMTLDFGEHGRHRATVETVEPVTRFAFRWALVPDAEPVDGNSVTVEFNLENRGDSTHIRLVESGFAALDGGAEAQSRFRDGNGKGWDGCLKALSEHLAA